MRGRRYPEDLTVKAISLRQNGWSLQEICEALALPKTTVQGWVKHVALTDTQHLRLKAKAIESAARGRPLAELAWQQKIDQWKAGIRSQVRHLATLPFNNPHVAQLACGLLYICEGAKYPTSRGMSFANTDPRMVKLFLKLLREHFAIDEKKFRVRVMHRWDQDGERLKIFWSEVTAIPLNQFYPSYADRRTQGHPTRKAGYRGICSLQYVSTTLQYLLQAIGENVLDLVETTHNRTPREENTLDVLGEPPPPHYQTVRFPVFPEEELVEQEGIEPSASCMPCKRSVQTELLPQEESNYNTAGSRVSMKRQCG